MSRFLVIGATGQQGGSVIDALEGSGHELLAFVRDADSDKARALAARGVELTVGTLDDQASIEAAFSGVDAAFAVTSPFGTSVEVEAEQGRRIADAAAAASLPFLVFSSVASADEATGIGHFESKYEAERRIAELGVPAAVVAPTYFMENYLFPWKVGTYAAGTVRDAFAADTALQMVSVADIGRSAAAVMQRPDEFKGQRIELVGDEITGTEIAQALGAAIGREMAWEVQPYAELSAFGDDMIDMYQWFTSAGYSADTERLARDLPEVEFSSFGSWAAAVDWDALLGAAVSA